MADEEPWKKIKTDPEAVAEILHTALQITALLAVVSEPILPFTAQKLKDLLQLPNTSWAALEGQGELLTAGHKIGTPELLFEKIEDAAIEAQWTNCTM